MSSRPVAFNAEHLHNVLLSLPVSKSYVVAFSGGADSTALLHALKSLEPRLDSSVSAIHVNHGLHADAGLWQSHCESFCLLHTIELTCLSIELQQNAGKGVEAEARDLRYRAMADVLEPGSALLTAHHADDQAETLLLNLMRGSGVDGLSAMPAIRPFDHAVLQRPLLGFQNISLKNYLVENEITWIEDPSNQILNHDRNFVRHEIIPLLQQRWPEVSKRLLLTSKVMSDTRHLLEDIADSYLQENLTHPFVLNISDQAIKNPELFKLVIRRWIKQERLTAIGIYQLETFCQQVVQAGADHKVSLIWGSCQMHLYKQQLWLLNQSQTVTCPLVVWPQGNHSIDLGPDVGRLVFEGDDKIEGLNELTVCARRDAKESIINQGPHHKSLKNLFQSAEIPPWLRDCIPLCQIGPNLVAMGDWCFSRDFAALLSDADSRVVWYPRNPLLQYIHSQQHKDKP